MAANQNQRPASVDVPEGYERRVFNLQKCEVRSTDDGAGTVFEGYAAVFNELSVNLGGFRERIQPGCFRDAVDEGQDVRFLINHDPNLVLGRTTAGTIKLTEDEVGLWVFCELPGTTYARDLEISMERRDIDQMSFGFLTRADDWKEKDAESGLPIRELLRADLFDVSVVTYPAYPDTSASVRTWIAEHNPALLARAVRAASDLEGLVTVQGDDGPDDDASEHETGSIQQAGARVEFDHAQCANGWAVVLNFNDEMQSCHMTEEAANVQLEALQAAAASRTQNDPDTPAEGEPEERVGKSISAKNVESLLAAAELLQTVLLSNEKEEPVVLTEELNSATPTDAAPAADAAEAPEMQEGIVRPDMKAFREFVAERGWTWSDDSAIWGLTQMIEAGSCFLLFEGGAGDYDDDAADDSAQATVMKQIMTQLTELLALVVAEASRAADPDPGAEERDTPDEPRTGRVETERRRLALKERELEVELHELVLL